MSNEALSRELVIKLAAEAGLECTRSCCNVPLKFCHGDLWRGDLFAFATLVANAVNEPRSK